VDLNIATCKLLGYPRQELLDLPVSKLFGHQLADLIVFTQAVLDKGRGWTEELSCNCKTGERIELAISATTLQIKGQQQLILVLRELSHEQYQRDQAPH
jgi:PAS domain S-box-containing protein